MADLKSIAELAWRQLFPEGSNEAKVEKEQFIADAKTEYARIMWVNIMNQRQLDGEYEIPSYLLKEKEFDVVSNEIDLTKELVMRGLPSDTWLQNVGGVTCDCPYIKTTLNHWQTLCGDDSLPENARVYYPLGKKIKLPLGAHAKKIPVIFATMGSELADTIEVDDIIGGQVRRALSELYTGKVGREDTTNNSNNDQ